MMRQQRVMDLRRPRRRFTIAVVVLAFALAASMTAARGCEVTRSVEAVDVHSADGVAVWMFRDLDNGGWFWAHCDCDLARGGAYRITCEMPWSNRQILECRR